MPIPATLGLNSYAAFSGSLTEATVIGDTCMLAHEVNPVIDALRRGGLEVIAIHTHLLGERTEAMFVPFEAERGGIDRQEHPRRLGHDGYEVSPETAR